MREFKDTFVRNVTLKQYRGGDSGRTVFSYSDHGVVSIVAELQEKARYPPRSVYVYKTYSAFVITCLGATPFANFSISTAAAEAHPVKVKTGVLWPPSAS